jgi:probable phosphoglycerate mutase
MRGKWQVKNEGLRPLAREASALAGRFGSISFSWIPREQNSHADRLANEAMDAEAAGKVWQPGDVGPATAEPTAESTAESTAGSTAGPVPNRLSGWQDGPGKPTTTLLLRHGQTALSVDKRFSGIGDPVLTEVGRAQAAAAAGRLARYAATAVISSPLTRARSTAEAVATALGLDVEVDEGLRETDFGDWEGYTFADVRAKWPAELEAWLASTAVAPPYGESFDATAVRVRQARDRILARYGGQKVVVVSHVTPIKTMLRMALDAPPSALYRMHLDLACISEVQWFSDGPAVVRSLNDTHHLDAQRTT